MDMPLQLRILHTAHRATALRPIQYWEQFDIRESEAGSPLSYCFEAQLRAGLGAEARTLCVRHEAYREELEAVVGGAADLVSGAWNSLRVAMLDRLVADDSPLPPREAPR